MSKLVEHAERELALAGYNTGNPEFEYGDSCAKNVVDMLKVFSEAGHSGFSANATLALFNKLANFENLTPLTDNPEEWHKYDGEPEGHYQSIRNSECFSEDGLKTYYKLSDCKVETEPGWYTIDKTKAVFYPLTSPETTEAAETPLNS